MVLQCLEPRHKPMELVPMRSWAPAHYHSLAPGPRVHAYTTVDNSRALLLWVSDINSTLLGLARDDRYWRGRKQKCFVSRTWCLSHCLQGRDLCSVLAPIFTVDCPGQPCSSRRQPTGSYRPVLFWNNLVCSESAWSSAPLSLLRLPAVSISACQAVQLLPWSGRVLKTVLLIPLVLHTRHLLQCWMVVAPLAGTVEPSSACLPPDSHCPAVKMCSVHFTAFDATLWVTANSREGWPGQVTHKRLTWCIFIVFFARSWWI